jgi:hypothetical protein
MSEDLFAPPPPRKAAPKREEMPEPDPLAGYLPNPGYQPEETKGRSVLVILAGLATNGAAWPANFPTNWKIRGKPYDIAYYRVI